MAGIYDTIHAVDEFLKFAGQTKYLSQLYIHLTSIDRHDLYKVYIPIKWIVLSIILIGKNADNICIIMTIMHE